jgi:methylaspartate mutase epsilon subunit
MELSDRRWEEDRFFAVRKEVLAQWPTGAEVEDLSQGIDFQKSLPEHKRLIAKFELNRAAGNIITMPQVGHATVEQTARHMRTVEDQGGADSWLIFMDTYTRKSRFKDAQTMLENSLKSGKSELNGYPCVCHGVNGVRKIHEMNTVPFIITNVDEDPRLATEIAFAGGVTGYLCYDLHDLLQHSKNYPLDQRIQNNQYGSRLVAYYEEHGAPILAWSSGHFTGWETPGAKIPIVILTSLLAAMQGVKHIAVSLGLGVQLHQDVAALRVIRDLLREYLDRFGFPDVKTYLLTYPFLGVWPQDTDRTAALIAWQATIGALAGVDCMIVKSLDEAFAIPRTEGNLGAMKIVKQILDVVGRQRLGDSEEVITEQEMLAKEVRAGLDKTLELGDGNIALGMIKAVEMGILDGVFSPWMGCHNKVLTVRDHEGALRYFDSGNLPLPPEVREYNRDRVAMRESELGRKVDMETVIADISFLSHPMFPQ